MRPRRWCAFARAWVAHEAYALADADAAAFGYCRNCAVWVMDDYPFSAICASARCNWSGEAERPVVGRYGVRRLRSLAQGLKCSQISATIRRVDAVATGSVCAVQRAAQRAWTMGTKRPKVILQDLK